MSRPLFLAAGTVLDAPPHQAIAAAADAGFDGLGLRLDPDTIGDSDLARIRTQLQVTGLALFDLEVIRLGAPTSPGAVRRLVQVGAELGARWILTVSLYPEFAQTVAELAEVAQAAKSAGMGIALEFMRFTEIDTLDAASRAVRACGASNVGVLVDALHLSRSGGTCTQLAQVDASLLAYAQLCDAPLTGPATAHGLADEARHSRLMPGHGELALAQFVSALPPDLPVAVEVQSDALRNTLDPSARARLAFATATDVLAQG